MVGPQWLPTMLWPQLIGMKNKINTKIKRSAFSKHAQSYDQSREQLIPCYGAFYATALEVLVAALASGVQGDNPESVQPLILDLGAGTGLTAAMILKALPRARMVLFDASVAMLDQARIRFPGTEARISYVTGNFQDDLLLEGADQFDAVFSGLAIHHLEGRRKKVLFDKISMLLKPGGIFVNADQVLGETPEIESRYRSTWLAQVKAAGVSAEALAASLERIKEDRMSPLSEQLGWLHEAGFQQVNCWFKQYSFAVFSGVRNQAS